MKRIYWRPKGISRTVLALIAALSVAGLFAVERFQVRVKQPHYEAKMAAAQLALDAMNLIHDERDRLGDEKPAEDIDKEHDPTDSGLIGLPMSSVTSDPGSLPAKQTSINPNFAALVVEWLTRAGVSKGDLVAVGVSGSFPALNICVYAALQTLDIKPIIISSAASSQWGANLPDLLWIDMERSLQERHHFFKFRSVAASIGGIEDRGLFMDPEGRDLLRKAVTDRNKLPLINPRSFTESVEERMKIYKEQAHGVPIKAYINVGGGTVSVGTVIGKHAFQPGLNRHPPQNEQPIDAVMLRFSHAGLPVIHLTQIETIAKQYDLPVQPQQKPEVGEGRVFYAHQYNLWLAAGVLMAILASLYAFIHTEIGFRILQSPNRSKDALSHEPMI